MANYTFHVPADTLVGLPLTDIGDIEIYSTSPTEVRGGLKGVTLVALLGDFQVDELGEIVGGTLTGWRTWVAPEGVTLESEVSGLAIDLLALLQWVFYGDEGALITAFFGGNDVVTGSHGADLLASYTGADTLRGGDGNDTLLAGAGDDSLEGGAGVDSMEGGPGADLYDVRDAGDVVAETISGTFGGTDTVFSWLSSYTLPVNVENATVMQANGARLVGNTAGNVLVGGGGADSLAGLGGADRLDGGAGADTLDGGAGADTMVGGNGNDLYSVRESGDVVVEASAGGTDTVLSWRPGYTLGANVENGVIMSQGAANLSGNALANVLTAGAGDNRLAGGAGSDTVSYENAAAGVRIALSVTAAQATGGSGSDTLTNIENLRGSDFADGLAGNAGANVLRGGLGNDTLTGGSGNDTLTGGGGNDTFRFVGSLTANVDTLTDFVPGRDRLELENGVFSKLTAAGPLAAVNFRANAAGTAVDGNDFVVYETDTGKLFYDADGSGSGAAVLIAVLTGAPSLAASDIFVT